MIWKLYDHPRGEPGFAIEDLPVAIGENLGSLLFSGLSSVAGVLLTVNIWVLNCEFDNYICTHVDTSQL